MVSPRKKASTLSLIPEIPNNMMPSSTKSCESLYSNTSFASSKGSATVLYRRKNPGGSLGNRQATLIPANTEVRQRVLSARRLRMKTYQNQLAVAQQTIADLAHENRILRTLHKRQDSALSKYESTNAELPQLLHSHAEELRVWQSKYRNLQTLNKEFEHKLKQKEAVILSLSDQNKYYSQLNKDKNLDERQRLSDKLQTLEARLLEKDNDMKLMARKTQLETKTFKKQLQDEQRKYKDLMLKLEKTRLELSGYRKLDEMNLNTFAPIGSLRAKLNNNLQPSSGQAQVGRESAGLEPKLSNDLVDSKYDADAATDEEAATVAGADYLLSQRSNKSENVGTGIDSDASFVCGATASTVTVTKLDANPVMRRNMRKMAPSGIPQRRRIDRGDGDATILNEIKRLPMERAQKQLQKPLSHAAAKAIVHKEEDEDVEDDVDDHGDYEHDTGNVVNALDDDAYEDEGDDEEVEYEDEDDEVVVAAERAAVTVNSARMQQDISSIRQQLCVDYKEREAFLDTFCRQASNGSGNMEPPKRTTNNNNSSNKVGNATAGGHIMPTGRKHKLLAALKAIDDNKSVD